MLGLIGGSGAGKSSIALALAGLLDPSVAEVSGRVALAGRDLTALTERGRDRLRGSSIGMIFQDPRGSLDPTMRVENQVIEALRRQENLDRSRAREVARRRLADAGIDPILLDQAPYAHQLSTGLCQRAMIAIALAQDPVLLIADEPTGALDVTTQARIMALLKQEQVSRGLAILLITHDLALAACFADTLLVMRDGEAVEAGTVDSVLNKPGHPYTRELVSAWRNGFNPEGTNRAPA